ncbi:MAG: phospholipase D-like domain-containing protein, partial [Alcanivorax nanhaiticus]
MSKPRLIILVLVALITSNALWHRYKPLPEGLAMHDGPLPVHNLTLLVDDTWEKPNGERGIRQQIFSEIFRLIRQAQKLVVVDMFLFNDFQGTATSSHRPLARELTDALLAKRQQQVPVILVTDPINTLYGGLPSEHLEQLKKAGVTVVITPLNTLRDSNPSWSGLWRLCCLWLGNDDDGGWLPNPMGPGKITLRSYLALPNFKANHRKTLVVDEGNDWTAMVTSANPHDGSSAHSNIALRFSGSSVGAVAHSEWKIAELAGIPLPPRPAIQPTPAIDHNTTLEVLTEAAIRDALLETIARSKDGDALEVSVFYLSHRPLIEALKDAHQRGVQVRVLLDPNKDAF